MTIKTDTLSSFTFETYGLFINVNQSVLKLNPIIKKYGYEFLAVPLSEFEKQFSDLVSLPSNFRSEQTLILEDQTEVSGEFYELLSNHHSLSHDIHKGKIILLKRIENFEQRVENGTMSLGLSIKIKTEIRTYISDLIQQLRLYKNGDIVCPMEFQITTDTRKVISKSWWHSRTFGYKEYMITDDDFNTLKETISEKFQSNPLTELAISSFNLSYEIIDQKTKYITLMTCLESLMNQGAHQITHTVSRHLALITSNSPEEFQSNYDRTKKLYDIRSKIVHGSSINENITDVTIELQDKVRKAIKFCHKLKIGKKELFDKLNASGYGPIH